MATSILSLFLCQVEDAIIISIVLLSTLFDYLTFGIIIFVLNVSSADQFRTLWFIESIISASFVVLIIRSTKPFFKSRPSKYLLLSTLSITALAIVLPFTFLGDVLDLFSVSLSSVSVVGSIVISDMLSAEIVKKIFYTYLRIQVS
jgi:Mg2+-importing ATPase